MVGLRLSTLGARGPVVEPVERVSVGEQPGVVGGEVEIEAARAAGEDPSVTNYVVGVRFWF